MQKEMDQGNMLDERRILHTPAVGPFSLAASAGPIRWSGENSPRHGIDGQALISVEARDGEIHARIVEQGSDGDLVIRSTASDSDDKDWFSRVFRPLPDAIVWVDPVLAAIASVQPGLHAFTDGSLFAGIVTSIVGQSISLASAAAVQRRLALSFHEGIDIAGRTFAPLPDAPELADASVELIRSSGVTWKRAEALRVIAREQVAGNLPDDAAATADPEGTMDALRELPLVGPWTAASALLWGVAAPDAFPTGDVALLRAARLAYHRPEMTMRELDSLAETWRPWRGAATRLLWANLLGPAWETRNETE